ncbi:Phosphoprotein phosphatase [Acidisarcina polymorpha]|uniref:Phosphoprotein phosphatase n=2 Tax=Acidisarcina polymorpha TaxID=2211140 RepID=A0A2Z5G7F7_9BACT|nr:Phosphoprotein phosphatase [Acidisarcina polymorpha]
MWLAGVTISATVAFPQPPHLSVPGQPTHAWTEFTSEGVSVRAIINGPDCPSVSVDGESIPMAVRAKSSAEFPVTTCQTLIPSGAKSAVVNGQTLALAPRKLRRIVVIGDTGCRLKGAEVQDCNDPKIWPFATMIRNAAAKHPDLVIHVGDYYYRETSCPEQRPGCNGSPHGDLWDSWRLDFFDPASSLLAAAPWIFARGNHEQCGRGSSGWFRFLDAASAPLTCPATSAPFAVHFDRLQLDVIDTADVVDKQLSIDRLAFYQKQISAIPANASVNKKQEATWVITHKPLWGYELTRAGQSMIAQNPMLAAAAEMMDTPRSVQLPGVDLLLAGHIHLFGALDFSSNQASLRPAQLIVGDSGTALDSADVRSGEETIDGLLAKYVVKGNFGYFVLDRKKKGWTGILYSTEDAPLVRCTYHQRQIECQAVE